MPYLFSNIPGVEASDRAVHARGLLRCRKPEEMEDGSSAYTSGIWVDDGQDKQSVKILVQDSNTKMSDPSIISLSDGFLVFGKAGRPFSVYTISESSKILTQPGKTDHEDLGRLLCDFLGVIQVLSAVKVDKTVATATWIVEILVDGGSFKAIVNYGPKPIDEIQKAVKSFVIGDCVEFHAQWDGLDKKSGKTPTFIMESMKAVNVADLASLAAYSADDDSAPATTSQAKPTKKAAAVKTTQQGTKIKQMETKGKRKASAEPADAEGEEGDETAPTPGPVKKARASTTRVVRSVPAKNAPANTAKNTSTNAAKKPVKAAQKVSSP